MQLFAHLSNFRIAIERWLHENMPNERFFKFWMRILQQHSTVVCVCDWACSILSKMETRILGWRQFAASWETLSGQYRRKERYHHHRHENIGVESIVSVVCFNFESISVNKQWFIFISGRTSKHRTSKHRTSIIQTIYICQFGSKLFVRYSIAVMRVSTCEPVIIWNKYFYICSFMFRCCNYYIFEYHNNILPHDWQTGKLAVLDAKRTSSHASRKNRNHLSDRLCVCVLFNSIEINSFWVRWEIRFTFKSFKTFSVLSVSVFVLKTWSLAVVCARARVNTHIEKIYAIICSICRHHNSKSFMV